MVDVLLGFVHGQASFVAFFVGECDGCLVRSYVRFDVRFELRQRSSGLLEGNIVLLGFDAAQEFVLANIQFRTANRIARFEKVYAVLGHLDCSISV